MAISVEPTPNPNAQKFSVGVPVGGPATYLTGQQHDDPLANELLALDGVTSVFKTADFVTLSKSPEGSWEDITDQALEILDRHLGSS